MSSSFAINFLSNKKAAPERNGYSAGDVIRELRPFVGRPSGVLQIDRRGLAGALIGLKLIRNLLTLAQAAHTGALERGGVHEHVLAAAVRLNESVALDLVIPLHGPGVHRELPSTGVCT